MSKKLKFIFLILTLLAGVTMWVSNNHHALNKNDEEGLGEALKKYLSSISEKDQAEIPVEYRNILLVYVDGATDSLGGWYLDKSTSTWTLTQWYKISDYARIAARVEVRKSKEQWFFGKLNFVTATARTKN